MDALVTVLLAVLALVIGLGAGYALAGTRARSQPNPLQAVLDQARVRETELSEQVAEAGAAGAASAEAASRASAAAAAAEAARDELREQVAQLTEQLHANTRSQQQESRVLQALSPVQENLRAMQTKIAEIEEQRSRQYGSIAEQLKQSQLADRELRTATTDLVGALKSNSVRGAWGEAQLRNIVESAGLTERVDFLTQTSVSGESGRQRPDMILRMPGGKTVPVDAKVPFSAYIQATDAGLVGAPDETARRKSLMAEHVRAVRAHVDTLASKAYWRALDGSPDFVVAFIPSEALLSAALEADPALLDYAFAKRVALASPVALWSVLKTIAFAWQQDLLTEDAKKLFTLSKELYERMGVLGGYADRLGQDIEKSVRSYNTFVRSLESRVLVTARKLAKLDESTLVPEPRQIDDGPIGFTASELAALPALPDEETGREPVQAETVATDRE